MNHFLTSIAFANQLLMFRVASAVNIAPSSNVRSAAHFSRCGLGYIYSVYNTHSTFWTQTHQTWYSLSGTIWISSLGTINVALYSYCWYAWTRVIEGVRCRLYNMYACVRDRLIKMADWHLRTIFGPTFSDSDQLHENCIGMKLSMPFNW